jgi:hypothetical protein
MVSFDREVVNHTIGLKWEKMAKVPKGGLKLNPIRLEVKVNPRLWDESKCQISPVRGLPCVGSLNV